MPGSGRKITCKLLDDALFEWFIKQRARQLPVTEDSLTTQARKIKAKLLQRPDTEDQEKLAKMEFTNGWIDRFKKRHFIRRRKVTTWSKKLASTMRKEIA